MKEMFADGTAHRLEGCAPLLASYQSCLATRSAAQTPPPAGWFAKSEPTPPPPTCNKQSHLLWACRASAVGCGSELRSLKRCRQGEGGECVEEQKKMGKCVVERMEKV